MDFSGFKKLTIGGIELKKLLINGIQVWTGVSYTNQIPISTDASGNIYNGKGFKENTFVNAGNEGGVPGVDVTGFIPCKVGDVLRFKNMRFTAAVTNCRLAFFKSDKSYIGQVISTSTYYTDTKFQGVKDADGNFTKLTITSVANITANCAYIRVSAADITANSIITVNQEID